MSEDLWTIVERKLEERAGNFSKSTSYLEYFDDIIATILSELVLCVDQTKITPELQAKINVLNQILQHSSINMSDLGNPLEGYKLAGIIELKEINSELRQMYMDAILNKNK
jgi:hypothetical protein